LRRLRKAVLFLFATLMQCVIFTTLRYPFALSQQSWQGEMVSARGGLRRVQRLRLRLASLLA